MDKEGKVGKAKKRESSKNAKLKSSEMWELSIYNRNNVQILIKF